MYCTAVSTVQPVYSFFWLTMKRYNLQIYIKYGGTSAPTKQKAFWYLTCVRPYVVLR